MALLVNGEVVDEAIIREERKLIRERLRQELPDESDPEIDAKAREWAVENVVERVLLRQAAQGFTEAQSPPIEGDDSGAGDSCATAPSKESLTNGAQSDWRMAAFLDHLTKNVPRPERREVSDYYRKNQMLFLAPECVRASHIVKNVDERVNEAEARTGIEAAEAALRSGRPFAEVADELSDCPGNGGDLGWFPRGEMVEEFEAVVFALKPGHLSPIFRSAFGFHLAKLHGRKPAGVLPLRDVYHLAEELMMKRRRDEAVERFLDDIRAKSDIRRVSANPPDVTS